MVVTTLKNQKSSNVLLKSIKESILVVDKNGNIHYSNLNLNSMFGYNGEFLFKEKITFLFPIKFCKKISTYLDICYKNSDIKINNSNVNLFGRRKNGVTFPIAFSMQHYNHHNKKMIIMRITEREKRDNDNSTYREKFLEQSLYNEKEIRKEQSKFVSKTSHELRSPLTTILNATTLLDKCNGRLGCEKIQTKNINRIKSSINQLTEVLNDFLTLDKIEKRTFSQQLNTNLSKFSSEIIGNIQNRYTKYNAIKYNHSGSKNVIIDREMLSSVFNNLLSNAIKYSPAGCPIEFSTKVENDILTAVFKDNGIGIPKDEQHILFKRYYRAKNTTNIQGTGLGLSIVKEHLLKIGGEIKFKSKPKKGTIFTVRIPVSKVILN